MKGNVKNKFIQEFITKGFKLYPRVSMLSDAFPTNFTPSGGEEHLNKILKSQNLKESFCVIQPCFRYQDINNIYTGQHLPLFEMGVAISVNQVTLKETIRSFFKIFDSLGLDRSKLEISILENSNIFNVQIDRDNATKKIWSEFGIKEDQFIYLGKEENFFMLPKQGYAGVKTEAFYYHNGQRIEIAVFIYLSHNVVTIDNEHYLTSFTHNVICHGIGIERWAMIIENKDNIASTKEFGCIIQTIIDTHSYRCIKISEDIYYFIYFFKALLFLVTDGGSEKNVNRSRRKIFNKLVNQTKELYKNNKYLFDKHELIKKVLYNYILILKDDYPEINPQQIFNIIFSLLE